MVSSCHSETTGSLFNKEWRLLSMWTVGGLDQNVVVVMCVSAAAEAIAV